jgi:hypothetical protein
MFETLNSVIFGPRGKLIVTMLEEIKSYLMERWATNRDKMFNLQPGKFYQASK